MKKLIFGLKNSSGRNCLGRITSFHRGCGVKNKFRILDFFRFLLDVPAKVLKIIKDPIRSSFIFLVCYSNGVLSYILGIHNVKIGDFLLNTNNYKKFFRGLCTNIQNFNRGSLIHNLEIRPEHGFKFLRAAGVSGVLLNRFNNNYYIVKMPSGEFRAFLFNIRATLGVVSNIEHRFKKFKKAGSSIFLNRRPIVRGIAKNPVDHPHGGQTSGGIHPVSPWGLLSKCGKKTRNKLSKINKLVLKRKN